jgi:acyl phosphate:glycerol-3-phosphate acyltransferase
MLISYFFGLVISYLVGSIPFGYVIAIANGVDVRKQGSGNIGATNVGRVLGRKFGIIIFILDLLKGFVVVVFVPILVSETKFPTTSDNLLVILCGLCAILGHAFPVYLGFKGGKAVATSFGVFIWLSPIPVAIAFGIWVLTVLVSRYVSLGSMAGAIALMVGIIGLGRSPFGSEKYLTALSVAVAFLIIIRHISNIKRIIAGTETRVLAK